MPWKSLLVVEISSGYTSTARMICQGRSRCTAAVGTSSVHATMIIHKRRSSCVRSLSWFKTWIGFRTYSCSHCTSPNDERSFAARCCQFRRLENSLLKAPDSRATGINRERNYRLHPPSSMRCPTGRDAPYARPPALPHSPSPPPPAAHVPSHQSSPAPSPTASTSPLPHHHPRSPPHHQSV